MTDAFFYLAVLGALIALLFIGSRDQTWGLGLAFGCVAAVVFILYGKTTRSD